MAKKKEEPKKPLATQLLFQAPDLPTPVANPRSGKPAEEAKPEPKRRERTRKEAPKERAKPAAREKKEEADSSTRVEAKRQRRRDSRDTGRRRSTITESEFLARRESVDRKMIVLEVD